MSLSERLYTLFLVDSQVRGLRSRVESAQRHLNSCRKQLEMVNQQRQELGTRQKKLKAGIANLEVETATVDLRLEKLRGELNSSSTNKQYTAVLTELNTVKVGKFKVEEQELADMELLETVNAELTGLEAQAAEKAKIVQLAEAQLAERQAEVGERLAELEKERATATEGIPQGILAIFDELADDFEGEALAPVEEIDRRGREYSCGACHFTLPFAQVAEMLTNIDTIERCGSCSRILHMQAEMKGSLVKTK